MKLSGELKDSNSSNLCSRRGKGILFLVATPIGNLKDITLRALEILKKVNFILCEDTRRSSRLFREYNINTPRKSFHDFNKKRRTPEVITALKEGENIALISDAGTPGISDPGFYLVREVIREKCEVISIPGPSALISALVASGLATDRFVFEGFLPRKSGKRDKRWQKLKTEERTIVLYESPHRIEKTLKEILEILGDRQVCLVKEMTKIYEQSLRGPVSRILEEIIRGKLVIKGELVLIVAGNK